MVNDFIRLAVDRAEYFKKSEEEDSKQVTPENTLNDKEKNKDDDEDEEDDYFQQLEARNKIRDGNPRLTSIANASMTHNSKFANKFSDLSKIRIYLFNTQQFSDFTVNANDTVRDLKIKILKHIIDESKYKLKYQQPEGNFNIYLLAFELRIVDDEDDDILPNMEFPALDDKLSIIKSRNDMLAFVEKINFDPNLEQNQNILGSNIKNNQAVQ